MTTIYLGAVSNTSCGVQDSSFTLTVDEFRHLMDAVKAHPNENIFDLRTDSTFKHGSFDFSLPISEQRAGTNEVLSAIGVIYDYNKNLSTNEIIDILTTSNAMGLIVDNEETYAMSIVSAEVALLAAYRDFNGVVAE